MTDRAACGCDRCPIYGEQGQALALAARRGGSARWLSAGLFCLALLLSVLALPALALAHAALVGADPVDGVVLGDSPSRFSLTFSEPVSPLVLTLTRPDGQAEALDSFRLRGQTVEIDAPPRLDAGTHVLSWRVVSADGHPIGGSLLFSIGAASTPPVVVGAAVDGRLRGAIWLTRVLVYAGLFFGAGGAFSLCWLSPTGRPGRRFAAVLMALGVPAAVLSLGLQGLDALELPLSRLALPLVWQIGFGTTFGWTVLIALVSTALGLAALAIPRPFGRFISFAALTGVGLALAASGHASDAAPQWLMRPAVFLHGVGIAFWTGALAPLALSLKEGGGSAAVFLRRFSRTILPVVAVLVGAGIVLALVQVAEPWALIETAYGRLLVAKFALLAALFALAAYNRRRLTLPAEAGEAGARRRLVRSIVAETLLVLAIFGVVAGWRFTPPPRALAIAAAQPATAYFQTLKAVAEITITPGRAGPVGISIIVMTGEFGPLDAKEITLVLSKPDAGIEPLRRPAEKAGDGTWKVDGLAVPLPGQWTLELDILDSNLEMVQVAGPVEFRP